VVDEAYLENGGQKPSWPDAACATRGCRRILIAEDADGCRHAGVYIIWDANSTYYETFAQPVQNRRFIQFYRESLS